MINIIAGDNRTAMRLDEPKIYGVKGLGIYCLHFVFHYSMDPIRGRKYHVRLGVLEVNLNDNVQTNHYVGRTISKEPETINSTEHSHQGQIEFILELQHHQIESIEKFRNGGGLLFELILYGEVTGHEQAEELTLIRNARTSIHVSQSNWIAILKNMGYGDILLFEIPIPKNSSSDIPENIIQYLRKAQKHYLAGLYDETIGSCRHVFDKLDEFLADKTSLNKISKKLLNNGNSIKLMTKEERFLLIRHANRHLSHLPHHPEEDEDGKNIPFTRNEAGMILGQTVTLVSFYLNRNE